jgi:hypothetical protein
MLSGDEYEALEESFPKLSGLAFKRAFEQTLAAGQSAVIASDGIILEVFPDGRRVPIGTVKKAIPVEVGARYVRRDAKSQCCDDASSKERTA